ncbi:MAG TPA: nucleoside hydrolase [Bryobacteraceae bacterium]|nr:nucleoside hydrolase [Bryobacteraceae bacterium]
MRTCSAVLFAFITLVSTTAAPRPSPIWPPTGQVRMIIDTDTANEIDDQYAIALALGFPEKIRIEGFVAAHFGDAGGSTGIDKSFAEIEATLSKARMAGKFPVKRGLDPLQYRDRIPTSDGVEFIIEKAKQSTPQDPLWLVLLGPATDAAAALIKEPSIADRMIVFWHGRTQWPLRAWNFNAYNDIRAARLLFELPCRFILFDTGTYLRIPMEETKERYAGLGPLGAYLYEIRLRKPAWQQPSKGVFDLGDIAAFVDPSTVRWEKVEAPFLDQDLRYDFNRKQGEIIRIYHVESEPTFALLEKALRTLRSSR